MADYNKYIYTCKYCGIDYQAGKKPSQKTCGLKECSRKYERDRYIMYPQLSISPGSIGAMSELRVSAYLLYQGFAVFRSVSPNSYCDLIAVKDKNIYHIEVRTGKVVKKRGAVIFGKTLRGNANLFGVYEYGTDQISFYGLNGEKVDL